MTLLILRLIIIACLAGGFVLDYLTTIGKDKIIALKDETIAAQESIIKSESRTIEEQRKNIEMRKEKMGY